MLALTDSAFDLLVLQLFFQTLLFCLAASGFGIFSLLRFPVRGEGEDDVLTDCCGACLRACWFVLRQTEFLPLTTLCDCGIDFFDMCHGFCLSCGFDFAALVIVAVGDCGFDSCLAVECGRRRREFG